ncbi:hypothetical protein PV327_004883 [Microctonus hyperodae]|uniref:Calcium release-activated calcium channel protein 1 n=1 Tax=Microctonus hyperodae TaxID=165561 RepID=A0AA39FDD6_MICHY|nr:hypothetical protein PV327_004883 [Microctonus hyperodae]
MSNEHLSNLNIKEKINADEMCQNNYSESRVTMATKRGRLNEETISKRSKSTQSDNWQTNWRPGSSPLRTRPLSTGGYSTKSNPFTHSNQSFINPSFGNSSKSLLYSSRSEVILSPNNNRTIAGKFVALDATATTMHPSLFTGSNLSGNNSCCTCCCCNCNGHGGKSSQQNEHDGPQGLSWRRLHMSRAKLKATATTSELLSGFAMVAMVELQINEPTAVPEWLFVMFAVCTTVLVSVHIFALMISTYLLPNVEAISKLQISRLITESPHERMRGFIELAWAFSTVLGLFLFLVEIAILCWVKFWDYSFNAAMASTIIVIPVLIVFVAFAVHFYHSLVVYKCESSITDMEELESIKKNLDSVTINQSTV